MHRLFPLLFSLLLSGCFAEPGKHIGLGMMGLIFGFLGFAILFQPAKVGGQLFLKFAQFLFALAAVLLFA